MMKKLIQKREKKQYTRTFNKEGFYLFLDSKLKEVDPESAFRKNYSILNYHEPIHFVKKSGFMCEYQVVLVCNQTRKRFLHFSVEFHRDRLEAGHSVVFHIKEYEIIL